MIPSCKSRIGERLLMRRQITSGTSAPLPATPPKSGRQSHKISTCPENIINRKDTVHDEMCCNSGPPSRPHLCQTNGKFRNKSTAAAGQQNGDCPVRQQGWPDAEDNGSIVLHFSGCGQAELAGIIWILYGTIPSYSVHSIALQTRGGGVVQ